MPLVPSFWSHESEWKRLVAAAVNPIAGGYQKVGYSRGGVVTQATNKATGVTLNALSGEITLNNAALLTVSAVQFTLTNNSIEANDILLLEHGSAGTFGAYVLRGRCAAGSALINVYNQTLGTLSEAIVIRFAVFKCSLS